MSYEGVHIMTTTATSFVAIGLKAKENDVGDKTTTWLVEISLNAVIFEGPFSPSFPDCPDFVLFFSAKWCVLSDFPDMLYFNFFEMSVRHNFAPYVKVRKLL